MHESHPKKITLPQTGPVFEIFLLSTLFSGRFSKTGPFVETQSLKWGPRGKLQRAGHFNLRVMEVGLGAIVGQNSKGFCVEPPRRSILILLCGQTQFLSNTAYPQPFV